MRALSLAVLTAAFAMPALQAAPPAEKPYGVEAAKESLKGFKVAEGLKVELFAAEPQIQNPTNIDLDPRGRVWAVEAVNYRTTMRNWGVLRPEGDRVVILEDTNGDGLADKETTFWQSKQLTAPLGICVLPQAKGTKVIVSAAPNVWLLTDSDGDDQAEKAEKLFTVGGNWDHDHQVHAFVTGPDGKFYFNMGNEGRELKDADGKPITDVAGNEVKNNGHPYRQGLVFRCDIDLEHAKPTNVETLAWNFRNNDEVTVDSFGTLWQSDNDDDGNKGVRINYVMQFGNYGYGDEMTGAAWQQKRTNIEQEIPLRHWHQNDPGSIPNLLQTGSGSPTGILINEGTFLGERFRNQLIHCDAGPRVVRAYPTTVEGAGYSAQIVDILTSDDQWYRPSDVCIAPDGALFISDWYDPGVGGHNMGDHDAGKIRGRIYRIAPEPAKKLKAPDFSSAAACTLALQSPNRATQYVARQKLQALGDSATAELKKLAEVENPRLRARAVGLLSAQPANAVAALRAGLADQDADVRVAAIRLTASRAKTGGLDTSVLENEPQLITNLLRDPEPRVRRELALALHGAHDITKFWAALALQHDGKDRWYLEALGIGAAGNDGECFDTWMDLANKSGAGWKTPAGRDIIWRLRTLHTAPYLAELCASEPAPARYLRAFDFLPASDEKTQALLQLARLGAQNQFVSTEALQRLKSIDLGSNAELKSVVYAALEASRGKAQFVELVRDFKLKDQSAGLLEIALARPASPEGVDATKILLGDRGVIDEALKGANAAKLTEALGNTADARAVPTLAALVLDDARDVTFRKQAATALTQSPAGVEALLKLATEGKFPEPLRLATTTALAAVQMPKYKDDIAKLFPPPQALGGAKLPPIAELAKKAGNAEHGKALFAAEQTSCITCHRIGQLGVDFAPALSEIGSKLSKEALFESIIDPNAGVSMGFETTQLTLKDGNFAVGIVRSEVDDEVVLAMPRGIQVRYKKGEIASRTKLPTSMMPSGLNQALSGDDLVDLVEYLYSLKAAKK
jgi:putative membrane-bound dehydrogenase-like protein